MRNQYRTQKQPKKLAPLVGSRQVVESAIDATKTLRNRTWEASARVSRIAQKIRKANAKMMSCVD